MLLVFYGAWTAVGAEHREGTTGLVLKLWGLSSPQLSDAGVGTPNSVSFVGSLVLLVRALEGGWKVSQEKDGLLPGELQGGPPWDQEPLPALPAPSDQPSQKQQHFGLSCHLAPCNSSVALWGWNWPHARHSLSYSYQIFVFCPDRGRIIKRQIARCSFHSHRGILFSPYEQVKFMRVDLIRCE